ncbi:MAG: hypothetical protein ACFCUE_08485 [Candidatus Bathyarchaeia archaeon]|jgi:hypothetical protein
MQEKILESFSVQGEVLSAIFLTYNFEIEFFVKDLLRQVLDVSSNPAQNIDFMNEVHSKLIDKEITVIANKKDYVLELQNMVDKFFISPEFLGYKFLPANYEVFHPKLYLIIYKAQNIASARLIVSSANLTQNGIRENAEIFALFELNRLKPIYYELFKDVLDFLSIIIRKMGRENKDFKIIGHLETLLKECKHIQNMNAKFIHSLGHQSILAQIEEMLQSEKLSRLRIISPFYEDDIKSTRDVSASLFGHTLSLDKPSIFSNIQEIDVFFSAVEKSGKYTSGLPLTLINAIPSKERGKLRFFPLPDNRPIDNPESYEEIRRFKHAKALLFETNKNSFLLTGSANFSSRALLSKEGNGNVEACILLRRNGKSEFDILPNSREIKLNNVLTEEKVENSDEAPNDYLYLFLQEAIFDVKKKELILFLSFQSEPINDWKISLDGKILLAKTPLIKTSSEIEKVPFKPIEVKSHFLTLSITNHGEVKIPIRFENLDPPEFRLDYNKTLLLLSGEYSPAYLTKMQQLEMCDRAMSSSIVDSKTEDSIKDYFKALDGIRAKLFPVCNDKFSNIKLESTLCNIQELSQLIINRINAGIDSPTRGLFKLVELMHILKEFQSICDNPQVLSKCSDTISSIRSQSEALANGYEKSFFRDYLRDLITNG